MLFNPSGTAVNKLCAWKDCRIDSAGRCGTHWGVIQVHTNSAINLVRFKFDNAAPDGIGSGVMKLYGMAGS